MKELLYERLIVQEKLKSLDSSMKFTKILTKFRILMSRSHVNGALKLLTNKMSNEMLSLTDISLQLLKQKHPELD